MISGFRYSRWIYGEAFYLAEICSRDSGYRDVMPLMFSEKLLDVRQDYTGCDVCITGQLRSYDWHEGTRSRLVPSVFVQKTLFLE